MYKYFAPALILIFVFATQIEFAGAGTLTCSVTTAAACAALPGIQIYRMSGATNAHAELGTRTTAAYDNNVVCCSGVAGLGNSCSGTYATALNLTAAGNSHASQSATAPYTTPACISVTSGSVLTGYVTSPTTCTGAGYDTTLGSMFATINSHVGTTTAYTNKVCATAAAGASNKAATSTLTSSIFDTGVTSGATYNSIMWKGMLPVGPHVRFQLAASDVSTGPWNYYGGSTCGSLDWFDPLNPDTPIELNGLACTTAWNNKRYFRYKVELCSNDCVTAGPNTPTVNDIVVSWAP